MNVGDATLISFVTAGALGLRILVTLVVAGVIAATAWKVRPVAAAALCGAVLLETSEMLGRRVLFGVLYQPSRPDAQMVLAAIHLLSILVTLAVGGLVVFGLMKLAEPRQRG